MAQVSVGAEEKVNVLELCAEMAKEEGVEYIFSLIGGNSITMDFLAQKAGIKRVHVRHEQTAGFAMDAWGRLSRRPALCIIGPGTGLTNFVTGVTQCYAAGAPGVGMVAESGTIDDDLYGGQGVSRSENQFQGITKWVRRVTYPSTLLWQLKRAFRSAVTPPTGPVVIGYTTEIAPNGNPGIFIPRREAYTNYAPGWTPHEWKMPGDPRLVEQLVKWLLEAERPVMVVGAAAHQDDCQDELREFVHLLGIPTNARRVARGMISEEDPLNYQKARGPAVSQADRCLVFGIRVGSMLENFAAPNYYPPTCRYAQVQDAPEMVFLGLRTEIEVIGHLKVVLQQMIQVAKDMGIKGPVAEWAKWRQLVSDTAQTVRKRTLARTEPLVDKMPLHPDLVGRYTAEVLSEKCNNDYVFIIDALTGSGYFSDWVTAANTGTVLDASETIGLGHGIGMALAAGLYTERKKPIISLLGDGAIGCAGMDVDTCVRWNIPVIFIHENNNTLAAGMFDSFMGKVAKPAGNKLQDSWEIVHDVRYDKMFAEMGCHTEIVERSGQVKPAVERAIEVSLREQRPSFVECFVDPSVTVPMVRTNPDLSLMWSKLLTWDEVPDKGKALAADLLVAPALFSKLPKDWQEGITALQKR